MEIKRMTKKSLVNCLFQCFNHNDSIEVLNFFQASLRNCKNCNHNCEGHSSFNDSILHFVVTE